VRQPYRLSKALKAVLATVVPSTFLVVMPAVGMAQAVLPLGSFRSVTLRNGGEVTLRHASNQRVTLLREPRAIRGDDRRRRPAGDRSGDGPCPKGYKLAVEILTPNSTPSASRMAGRSRPVAAFPPQAELRVAVENGGTIDLRSMPVEFVNATVREGGRILTKPRDRLTAKIAHWRRGHLLGGPSRHFVGDGRGRCVQGRRPPTPTSRSTSSGPSAHCGARAASPPVPPTRARGRLERGCTRSSGGTGPQAPTRLR